MPYFSAILYVKPFALERREYLGQTVGKVGVSAAFKGNSEL